MAIDASDGILSARNVSRFIFIFLAALAHAASGSWPFDAFLKQGASLWWLQLASIVILFKVVRSSRNAAQATLAGWWFATVWLANTFWWLYISMHTYGGLHAVLAALAVLLLASALALYYGAACGLFRRHFPTSPSRAALYFSALWVAAELARGTWLTGFGWGAAGYSHTDGPLAPYVPWIGVYGVSALAAWLAASLAVAGRAGDWQRAVLGLVMGLPLFLPFGYSEWSLPAGKLSVTLLQGNIAQDEKFRPGSGVPEALDWYSAQLDAAQTSLVIAPETAIPLLPAQLPDGYWYALQHRYAGAEQLALVGIPLGSFTEGYTNSVIAVRPGQSPPWQYDKHHLVPFGEFVPPLFRWFTRMMDIPLGDFNRGGLAQPPYAWKGQQLSPNICFEDLYGEELAARFQAGLPAPTIFVNVSNLGWFDGSVALDQHLQISRMRALEFQRPFVRATNTGATAIIDHGGRVISALPYRSRGVLVGQVEGRTGTTPYAWWASRWGLWPIWLVIAVVCLWVNIIPWRPSTASVAP